MDAEREQNSKDSKKIKYRDRTNNEKHKLLEEKDKKNTQVATEHAVANFSQFLTTKQYPNIHDLGLDRKQLDSVLLDYYASIQPQVRIKIIQSKQ